MFVLVALLPAIGAIICLVTDLTATVAPIGVKFWIMVHIRPGHKVSLLGGGIPKQPQMGAKKGNFWQFWPIRKAF